MDHLPWYKPSDAKPVRVPFVCSNDPICDGDDFFEFPENQEWQWGRSGSLGLLARRAQAWALFGLLGMIGIPQHVCIRRDTEDDEEWIDTSGLPDRLRSLWDPVVACHLAEAVGRVRQVMAQDWIPVLHEFDEHVLPTLWNSPSFAVFFSLEVFLDALEDNFINLRKLEGLHSTDRSNGSASESLLAKFTPGIARSLIQVGKCGSLAYRLPFTASQFYHLMSLPNGLDDQRLDHSQCQEATCSLMNVNPMTYRTQHAQDCLDGCQDVQLSEEDLIRVIQRDDVPMIKSTMDSKGNVRISVVKMTAGVDYTAISHVWAGGLGNFQANCLPQCQLQALHRDVLDVMVCTYNDEDDGADDRPMNAIARRVMRSIESGPQRTQRPYRRRRCFPSRPAKTTCYYWLDTLCIPIEHYDEKVRAINSMGRIYAGAANVLVLDPALSRISFSALEDIPREGRHRQEEEEEAKDEKDQQHARANMLVDASPWMARSWPLQEAALGASIYVRFVDSKFLYAGERLGITSTLQTLPVQEPIHPAADGQQNEVLPVAEPYVPNTEFVSVWNQLTRRTTSYPEDVPAIFAALLYKSAGELLAIAPHLRSRAILRCVDTLPLDILAVEWDHKVGPMAGWVPRFPGSRERVPEIGPSHGVLQRTASGFLVQRTSESFQPTSTHILVCPTGLDVGSTGGTFSLSTFTVRIDLPPPSTSTSRGWHPTTPAAGPQLLFLLSKPSLKTPTWNVGILCNIRERSGNVYRVRPVDVTVTWQEEKRPQPDGPQNPIHDCFFADEPSSIFIETDTPGWPVLMTSRFTDYPFQKLQAQVSRYVSFYGGLGLLAMVAEIWCGWFLSLLFIEYIRFFYLVPTFVLLLVGLPLHAYAEMRRSASLVAASRRRVRYLWAMSFWEDTAPARAALSRLPLASSFYIMLLDYALMGGSTILLLFCYKHLDFYMRWGVLFYPVSIVMALLSVEYLIRAGGSIAFLQWPNARWKSRVSPVSSGLHTDVVFCIIIVECCLMILMYIPHWIQLLQVSQMPRHLILYVICLVLSQFEGLFYMMTALIFGWILIKTTGRRVKWVMYGMRFGWERDNTIEHELAS